MTRKGAAIQEQILDCIERADYPLSTRQLTLQLEYSWNTIQHYCLELVLKKKIARLQTPGSHLWIPCDYLKKSKTRKNQQITTENEDLLLNRLLEKTLDTEIERLSAEAESRLKKELEKEEKEEKEIIK